jgi:hypothetical protein
MTPKRPILDSPGIAALLGILAILSAVYAFGDRMWVTRDKFDDRMDRLEEKIDQRLSQMHAEIRMRHPEAMP